MELFYQWLKENRQIFSAIQGLAGKKKVKLYLVGGALRDLVLKKEKDNPDFDFCLKKGAINFARSVARDMKAGFVVLDQAHGCGRVVKKAQGKIITLDFSDFRAPTLADDLLLRDFTINSMALPLAEILNGAGFDEALIDLYGARQDLAQGLIRIVSPRSFDDDPLRLMRAFSLSAIFGFQIEAKTLRQISLKNKKLNGVSWERIRDELFKILATQKSFQIIGELDKFGLLELILPELSKIRKKKDRNFRRLDVWKHTLLTFKNVELLILRYNRNPELKSYLSQEISSGRKRAELLKLAALTHDIGKPGTFKFAGKKVQFHGHERLGSSLVANIALRLKLSNEELRFLKRIVFLHLRPGYLVNIPSLSAKAKFRFFRDAGLEAGSVLILALADERSTKGYLLLDKIRSRYERVIPRLLREYFSKQKAKPAQRLFDGNDIMRSFKLKPSPLIGKVLRELEEMQAIGRIKTKEEALSCCGKILKKIRNLNQ
jgi:poly(A) polymerase